MADTIKFNDSVLEGWIFGIESSLQYDFSSVEISSEETLSAVKMLKESMCCYVDFLKLLSENLSQEIVNLKAVGDSLTKADQKARGHFSGKL